MNQCRPNNACERLHGTAYQTAIVSLHSRPVFARPTTDILRRAITTQIGCRLTRRLAAMYRKQIACQHLCQKIRQVRGPGRACENFFLSSSLNSTQKMAAVCTRRADACTR